MIRNEQVFPSTNGPDVPLEMVRSAILAFRVDLDPEIPDLFFDFDAELLACAATRTTRGDALELMGWMFSLVIERARADLLPRVAERREPEPVRCVVTRGERWLAGMV